MRLMKNNKGQIRIIEAFFASVLILSSLALIPPETNVQNSNDKVLQSTARDILATLDSDGYLSKLIDNKNWTSLKREIQSSLPLTVWFNLTVFDENMQPINEIPICNGSPTSEKIVGTDYLCAGAGRNYDIFVIRLQLSNVS